MLAHGAVVPAVPRSTYDGARGRTEGQTGTGPAGHERTCGTVGTVGAVGADGRTVMPVDAWRARALAAVRARPPPAHLVDAAMGTPAHGGGVAAAVARLVGAADWWVQRRRGTRMTSVQSRCSRCQCPKNRAPSAVLTKARLVTRADFLYPSR